MNLHFLLSVCLSLLLLCLPTFASPADKFREIFPEAKAFTTPNYQIAEPTELQKETFVRLKKKFSRQLLDDDFKTLRKLAKHRDYLNFLSQVHPDKKRFKRFKQFTDTVQYPKERYFPFFEAHFNRKTIDEMTEEDRVAAHILANTFWHEFARKHHGETFQDPNVFLKPEIQDWMNKNEISINTRESFQKFLKIGVYLSLFVRNNQDADAALVKKFFEKYGQDNGLLWMAIQNPHLLGRILDGFTDIEIFLKWVQGDFYKKGEKNAL